MTPASRHSVFTGQKCPYHVIFDLNLDLQHNLGAHEPGTIVCKFGGIPAICLGKEEIFANVYRRMDGRTDDARRTMAYSSFHLGIS